MNKWLPGWLAAWLKLGTAPTPAAPLTGASPPAEAAACNADPAAWSGAAAAQGVWPVTDMTGCLADAVEQHSSHIESINAELSRIQQGDSAAVAAVVCKLLALNQELRHRLAQGERKLQEQARRIAEGCGDPGIHAEIPTRWAPAGQDAGPGKEERTADGRRRAHLELAAETFADPTFLPALTRRIAEWRRGGAMCSLVLARLDGSDEVVRQHGHQARQTALAALSQLASAALREMDQPTRWGEDGLAILLPGARAADAANVGRRLLDAIEHCEWPASGGTLRFSLSVGGAELVEGNDAQRLLERAWQALDAARHAGGGQIRIHDGRETIAAPPHHPAAV